MKSPSRLADELDDAVARGDLAEVLGLLARGASPNGRDVTGDTPLMTAAWVGAPDIVELLIARGADVNAVGVDGRNALQRVQADGRCREPGHRRAMEILRKAGGLELE